MSVLVHNARILTLDPSRQGALGVIERGFVRTQGETIAEVAPGDPGDPPGTTADRAIDAAGRVLMPAFVDAHTHALWAGDRLDEFDMKLRGASYLDILKAGGGIMNTVRAVRAASQEQLAANLLLRLAWMAREGTLTVEVKSGYGLTTRDELKMLRAIADAARETPLRIVPTALIAHAVDPDQPNFFDTTIEETLPAVHEAFPGVAIDAYCEQGAWPLEECVRLFEKARMLGHPIRVHADQFHSLGMTREAIELGALSVDHLEATSSNDLRALAKSKTFAVMLPCSGFQVDDRYASGRALLDAGGRLVIATNCNPGSAPTGSMPFAIALAARKLGLTAQEAVTAATRTPAQLLGLPDAGTLSPGARADMILLRHTDERMLAYEFAGNPVDTVVCAGGVIV